MFAALDAEFHFEIDVCATPLNAKCERYFSEKEDALRLYWAPFVCWMNPPYGREISRWVHKARVEAENGATVVALLPARTDTAWFHEDVFGHADIRFMRGRLRFVGAPSNAPFPSMMAIFRPPLADREE